MLALQETKRILKEGGFFGCMWNHRNTDDQIRKIVAIIKMNIPDYSYGLRREDPMKLLIKVALVLKIKETFEVEMKRESIINA